MRFPEVANTSALAAQWLHLTLHQLDQPDSLRRTRSQVYKLQERGGRTHRIAIYQPEKLLTQVPLSFVGFISARQKLLRPSIIQAIQRADKRLVEELAGAPGQVAELHEGLWPKV